MRRITVVQCLPALQAGGVERSTLETARALVQRGHRSIVISAGGRLQEQCIAEGSEHFKCEIGKKSLLLFRSIHKFRELLKELQPDIVHARSRLPAWSALLAMRNLKPKPKFITSVHGLNSPGFYSGVMMRGETIICVSDTVKRHVLTHWPSHSPNMDDKKIIVITPGIDPKEFPANLQINEQWRQDFFSDYPKLQGEKLLLLPARATRLKGHGFALNLLAGLRREMGDVRLCCLGARQIGREKYLQELQQQAEQLGISNFVEFVKPIKAIDNAYAISDLVLQLSNKPEAFGRTTIEALSVGRPVLGWNLGGVGENLQKFFPQGLVEPFNEKALLQSAKSILENKILPEPQALPSLSAMQSNMMELYEQLCP